MNHWPWITFGVAMVGLGSTAISFDAGRRAAQNKPRIEYKPVAVIEMPDFFGERGLECANGAAPRISFRCGKEPPCGNPPTFIEFHPSGAGGAAK